MINEHKANITEIDNGDVNCPYCNEKILDFAEEKEWLHPKDSACSHFLGCLVWEVGEFESGADDRVTKWWEAKEKEADDNDDLVEIEDLGKCPDIDHIIIHNTTGMACGPTCISASFCFKK